MAMVAVVVPARRFGVNPGPEALLSLLKLQPLISHIAAFALRERARRPERVVVGVV